MLVAWLTKGKPALAKPVLSQKFNRLQGRFLYFQLLLLLPSDTASWRLPFSTDALLFAQGLGQHKPFSRTVWRKVLECLFQKNKRWLMFGHVTCAMRCFARPPWLHCLTLISHINIWILDDNSSRLISVSYSSLEVRISKQKHVG